ncbi:caspase family protein [Bacillus thuringiensis]|nr:caspase family protein [Bacillus thuringiensis]
MNYLISVGIKKCREESIGEIPCAYDDANLIYETLKNILDTDFSDSQSICLTGPNLKEFSSVVKMLKRNLDESDNLIIYFSGHGDLLDRDELVLLFSDADDGEEGRYNLLQLKQDLRQAKFQTILILDCCYSGAGLSIANSTNIFSNDKISVLASSSPFNRATFDAEGSIFTRSLCNILNGLNESGRLISLRILAEEIRKTGNKCYVNISNGSPDNILVNPTMLIEDNEDFKKRFLMRIKEVDTTTREMHWYYLMDLPEITKFEVLNSYFAEEISEPHWLVRRAIGSVISEFKNFKMKESIILNLLRSRDWMAQCIGLIGARRSLDHESIRDEVKSILLSDTQIDAIWLANLYLSDYGDLDIDSVLSSSLSNTPWGVLDIWIRYSGKIDRHSLLEKIKETVDKSLLTPLFIHMYFESGHIEDEELLAPNRNSKLIPFLYELKKRGETKSAKQKWLFSSLYGNWRDQLDLKLRNFFYYARDGEVHTELELASNLPLVEMRMAIFQYVTI